MRLGKRTARLVREAMVLGFAEGSRWAGWHGELEDYPRDSDVQQRVFSTARSFNDIYPLLSRVETEPSGEREHDRRTGG